MNLCVKLSLCTMLDGQFKALKNFSLLSLLSLTVMVLQIHINSYKSAIHRLGLFIGIYRLKRLHEINIKKQEVTENHVLSRITYSIKHKDQNLWKIEKRTLKIARQIYKPQSLCRARRRVSTAALWNALPKLKLDGRTDWPVVRGRRRFFRVHSSSLRRFLATEAKGSATTTYCQKPSI